MKGKWDEKSLQKLGDGGDCGRCLIQDTSFNETG